MKDLCERTGMSRQAIHFYIRKGLVPPGIKRSKTSAEYTEKHVERILLVRRMQEEQFLPLDAIKATLDERDKAFSPPQRRLSRSYRVKYCSFQVFAGPLPNTWSEASEPVLMSPQFLM